MRQLINYSEIKTPADIITTFMYAVIYNHAYNYLSVQIGFTTLFFNILPKLNKINKKNKDLTI